MEWKDGNAILDASGSQIALVIQQDGFENKPLFLSAPKMLEELRLVRQDLCEVLADVHSEQQLADRIDKVDALIAITTGRKA